MTDMDMEKLKINSKKFYEGYNPARPKTKSDLEKLEAARLKRERKAAKKLSQNN